MSPTPIRRFLVQCAAAVTLAAGTRGGLVSGAHADAEPGQQQVLAPVGGEQHAADSSDTMTPDERLKAAEALKKKITALSAKLLAHGSAAVQAVSDEEKTLRTLRYKLAKHKAAGKVEKAKVRPVGPWDKHPCAGAVMCGCAACARPHRSCVPITCRSAASTCSSWRSCAA